MGLNTFSFKVGSRMGGKKEPAFHEFIRSLDDLERIKEKIAGRRLEGIEKFKGHELY